MASGRADELTSSDGLRGLPSAGDVAVHDAPRRERTQPRWWWCLVVVGPVLWMWPRGALWLDEAQSVAIARSAGGIVDGLRADGAPPLYYALLHVWMRVVGDGDAAVRSLSAVAAAGAVLVTALLVKRLLGATAAVAAAAIMSVHPFLVRYASEARMYTTMCLAAAAILLLADRTLRGGRRVHVALALTTTAALLTHYWAIPFVAGGGVLAAAAVVTGRLRSRRDAELAARRVLLALVVGGVLTAPWWPVARFQSQRTGTPWSSPPSALDAVRVLFHRGTGTSWMAVTLTVSAAALILLAITDRPARSTAHAAAPAPAEPAGLSVRVIAAHALLTALLAFVISRTTSSAFMPRYTSVLFPSAIVLTCAGWVRLRWAAARAGALLSLTVLGVVVCVGEIGRERTRAEMFATAMARGGLDDGDLVLYCPDQLGPSVDRLLARTDVEPVQWVYPTRGSPERVDWIDYRERHERASVDGFLDAAALVARTAASTGIVWLVVSETYPPTQAGCSAVLDQLVERAEVSEVVIVDDPSWQDHDQLWRFELSD